MALLKRVKILENLASISVALVTRAGQCFCAVATTDAQRVWMLADYRYTVIMRYTYYTVEEIYSITFSAR